MKNLNTTTKQLMMVAAFLFGGLLVSTDALAQKPMATLTAAGVLQLPTNLPLTEAYQFDLSSFGFQTQEEAIAFFSSKSFADFGIRPNVSKNKGSLTLDLAKHPGWTVAQWNSLLLSATAQQPLTN